MVDVTKAGRGMIGKILLAAGVLKLASATANGGGWVRPVNGRCTSPFGPRTNPVTGEFQNHNGADYACAEGTAVLAAFDGSIQEISEDGTSGKYLKLLSADRVHLISYCHLSDTSMVKVGQVVKAGVPVARSGKTGRVTGPHLHVTLRKSGQVIDPELAFNGPRPVVA